MMSRQYHEVGKGCPGPVGYPDLHDGQLLRLSTFRPRTLQRAHRRWGAFRDRYGRRTADTDSGATTPVLITRLHRTLTGRLPSVCHSCAHRAKPSRTVAA